LVCGGLIRGFIIAGKSEFAQSEFCELAQTFFGGNARVENAFECLDRERPKKRAHIGSFRNGLDDSELAGWLRNDGVICIHVEHPQSTLIFRRKQLERVNALLRVKVSIRRMSRISGKCAFRCLEKTS